MIKKSSVNESNNEASNKSVEISLPANVLDTVNPQLAGVPPSPSMIYSSLSHEFSEAAMARYDTYPCTRKGYMPRGSQLILNITTV